MYQRLKNVVKKTAIIMIRGNKKAYMLYCWISCWASQHDAGLAVGPLVME